MASGQQGTSSTTLVISAMWRAVGGPGAGETAPGRPPGGSSDDRELRREWGSDGAVGCWEGCVLGWAGPPEALSGGGAGDNEARKRGSRLDMIGGLQRL